MGILRGSRIKVEIYSARTKRALDQSMSDDKSQTNSQEIENGAQSSATDLLIDPNLTDTYYVKELVYTYNPSQSGSAFTTEIILSKRNWLPNQLMENIT
jgi:outer membrane lipoprotein-sorting protein